MLCRCTHPREFHTRIADLEAELDKTRAELGHQWGLVKVAEAEVERLRGHLPVVSPLRPGTTNRFCKEHARFEAFPREERVA